MPKHPALLHLGVEADPEIAFAFSQVVLQLLLQLLVPPVLPLLLLLPEAR